MRDPLSAEFPDIGLLNPRPGVPQNPNRSTPGLGSHLGFTTLNVRSSPNFYSEALLTFYDFPADHWDHLRTGNPIESVFATVRHRTVRTRGALSQKTAKLMVFKLVQAAAKTWRRLKGANQSPLVIEGVTFTDGVAASDAKNRAA